MHRSKIEWCRNPDGSLGWVWNPITGCLNGCEYCYARKLANGRLRERYLEGGILPRDMEQQYPNAPHPFNDPFYPRFWEDRLGQIPMLGSTKSLGIFVCDMSDLFGVGIPRAWTDRVLWTLGNYWQHRFYLLTKQPQNLIKFSPFPDNCQVGVTAITNALLLLAIGQLEKIQAKVKFLSIEPMLYELDGFKFAINKTSIDWVIIGACTGTMKELLPLHHKTNLAMIKQGNKWTLQPQIEWVREIIEACDKAGVKVFLKNNLLPLIKDVTQELGENYRLIQYDEEAGYHKLRQEIPNE